jgi:predicted kinase
MNALGWRPATRPPLVIVSGAPASGKTTLSRLLADRLPLPLLSKDRLRVIFADAFDANTLEENRRLLGPGFVVFYELIAELLRAGVGVVAECNFHRGISEPEMRPVAALGTTVIVHCQVDRALSVQRFIARHKLELPDRRDRTRHPAGRLGAGRADRDRGAGPARGHGGRLRARPRRHRAIHPRAHGHRGRLTASGEDVGADKGSAIRARHLAARPRPRRAQTPPAPARGSGPADQS